MKNCVQKLIQLTSVLWILLIISAATAFAWRATSDVIATIGLLLFSVSLLLAIMAFRRILRLSASCSERATESTRDPLTGLGNRREALSHITAAIDYGKRHGDMFGVIFADLNRFKYINDVHGHLAGDEVLKIVAMRFKDALRSTDHAFRLGGDEYLILVTRIERRSDCQGIAGKLREALRDPALIDGKPIPLSASLGCSIYPLDGEEMNSLIEAADQRMYRQKKQKR